MADGERIRAETQQKKAESLLGQTQQSLEFMNWELRPVLEQYVKTEVKEQLISRVEDMLKTLKPYQSAEQSSLNQITLMKEKALVLLQNKNSKDALTQALALQLEAKDIAERFSNVHPYAKLNLAAVLADLGQTSLLMGNVQQTLSYLQESKNIIVKFLEHEPDNIIANKNLAQIYDKLGDASLRIGSKEQAFNYYQSSVFLFKVVMKLDPRDVEVNRDLCTAMIHFGDLAKANNKAQLALDSYMQAKNILLNISNAEHNMQIQRELSLVLTALGDLEF